MMIVSHITISLIVAQIAVGCYVISKPPVGRGVLVKGSVGPSRPEHAAFLARNPYAAARLASLRASRATAAPADVATPVAQGAAEAQPAQSEEALPRCP